MVSPWSSVPSLEDNEEVTVGASSQQQQSVSAKAGSRKRARPVDLSSSNLSASASRKSVACKKFKAKEEQVLSSEAKPKAPLVKRKASKAKQHVKEGLILSSSAKEKTPLVKHEASTAKRFDVGNGRAWNLEHWGIILVLFETPSGFAIFNMHEEDLKLPEALQDTWANFGAEYRVDDFVWLSEFRKFKDKTSAINHDTGVSWDLTEMIRRWHRPGQKMAVGKHEYKEIIERNLGIPCLFDDIVMEVMWGLQNLMHFLVPKEKKKLRKEDRIPMSLGLKIVLNRYGFDFNPEMVNKVVIMLGCLLLDCEYVDVKNTKVLRLCGEFLKDISGIESEDWDLMKLATALKIACHPAKRSRAEEAMFTRDEVSKFVSDAHKYQRKICKVICLSVYNDLVRVRRLIPKACNALESLAKGDKNASEVLQSW